MTDSTSPATYRVTPRVWIGVVVFLAYVVIIQVVQALSGVPYTDFGKNAGTLFWGAGLSLIIAAVFFAITASLLGWWRPALFERQRSRATWTLIAPALMAVALLINLASTDWAAYDGAFFAASIVLLLVGFVEEMATRGILLVSLRARLGEGWVWFLTSAAFGLMHLTNAFGGQDIPTTLLQVVMAFLGGTIFYILRRTTGTLIWAMVLHGLWDFSTFAVTHGVAGQYASLAGLVNQIACIVGLITVVFVIRGAHERTAGAAQPAKVTA